MTLPPADELLNALLARCKAVPLSRFSQPVFWLLLLLLAQQGAALTWQLWALTHESRSQPWQPAPVTSQGEASRLDLGVISRLSLFGKAPLKVQAGGAGGAAGASAGPDGVLGTADDGEAGDLIAANAPRTSLNAQLTGLLASSTSAKSIAIIAYNGKQNTYSIGDYIDGTQARIRQIFADRIIIAREGRDETLMLDGEEYGKPLPQPQPTRQDDKRSAVPRELMNNPGKITDYLNISPVQVDGRMVGYRLNPGSKPELFNRLGLVANDLAVSINGLDLRDSAQAMQAMQQVADATEMTVTVERQGQLYDVAISLSE